MTVHPDVIPMKPSEAYQQLRAANDATERCAIRSLEGRCDSCDSQVLYALGDLAEAGVPLEREVFALTDAGRTALSVARPAPISSGGSE